MSEEKKFNNDKCVSSPTWGELLAFIRDNVDPKFYDKPASILIGDDGMSKAITSVEKLQNDIYVHKDDDEDGGPLEDLKFAHGDEFKEEDYELRTREGHPFLYLDEA